MKKYMYIAFLGVSAALTVALIYIIRVPMFLPFLEYDPGDIPIYFCTFAFGPFAGFVLTAVASVIQGLTVSAASGWIGILMHIFATGSFVLTAGFIYKRSKRAARLYIGSATGLVVTVAVMVVWNLILTPVFMNAPVSAVVDILPAIIAFNVIKVSINSVVAIILYKSVYKYINYNI
jgi:riboflavin transporter FmnP